MKIVHICLTGPYSDGWVYQENLLARYHKKNGHDVSLIAPNWTWNNKGNVVKCDSGRYTDEYGVDIIRVKIVFGEINTRLKKYNGIYKLLKSEAPDIIFIHNCQFVDFVTVCRYIKNNNVVSYADNHVDFSNGARNWLSYYVLHKCIWKHIIKMGEKNIRMFYGVLPARVDFLIDMYSLPSTKCKLLVMGADDELVAEANKPREIESLQNKYLGNKHNQFLIVTGGKIDPAKRQTLSLMKAVNELTKEGLPITLVVFGSVHQALKKEFESEISESVVYGGWLSELEAYKHFAAADLVIFPGRHSVYWEQVVALGKPMVCKYWEGTTHIDLGGNVEFIKSDDYCELLSCIRSIILDKHRYMRMKLAAESDKRQIFLYSNIARKSIEE